MIVTKYSITTTGKETSLFIDRSSDEEVPVKYLKLAVDTLQYLIKENMIIMTSSVWGVSLTGIE